MRKDFLGEEDIKLLREFKQESTDYLAKNLDKMIPGNALNMVDKVCSHILVEKGKKVIKDCLSEGL